MPAAHQPGAGGRANGESGFARSASGRQSRVLPDKVWRMSEETARVICIGEALIELTRGPDGAFTAACAGDSFNTAVYLARAGLSVGFATAVGDDPYSDSIVALALAEGLEANLILRVPGRLPAL